MSLPITLLNFQLKIISLSMRINLTLLAVLSFGLAASAQELPKVIPPSPTATSLGQYGAVPVSNYTGIPNIQVPLYDIKSGEINLPITLSYYASGIKVSQESSSVGLGWSLNAWGAITRSVLGVDDLKPQRGYAVIDDLASTDADLPANYNMGHPDFEKYQAISSGQRDGQPDLLYYNFMGVSGKLIFDKKETGNNIIKGIPLEQTNIQFAYDTDEQEWEVTDSNGWKYYFNVKEMSLNHNSRELYTDPALYGNGRFLFNVDRMDNSSNVILSDIFVSSWYLNKIVTPKGDVVVFEYDQDSQYKGISQMSYYEQESYYGDPLIGGGDPFLYPIENLWHGYFSEYKYGVTANMQSFDNVNLKKITFNNGYIQFTTSDREDLRAQNGYPKAQKIESFEVFDVLGRPVKKIDFDYSYFNQSTTGNNKENYLRLKLDGVQELFFDETSGIYVSKPPYTFNYNSTSLPAKTSAGIDHWGYYNGIDNDHIALYGDLTSSLYDTDGNYNFPVIVGDNSMNAGGTGKYFMPFQIECGPSSVSTRYPFLNGAYREPDAQKMQAAILTQIKYPTGGATRFTYSPNEYIAPTDVDFYRYERTRFSMWHEGLGDAETRQFTLNYYTIVNIDCRIFNNGGSASELTNVQALIKKATGENVILFQPTVNDFWKRVQLILPPGSYEAFAKTNAGSSIVEINMSVEFVQQFWTDETYNKMGGGLRLSVQEDLDTSGDVVKKRTYDYETGRAMTEIQHFYKDVGFESDPFSSPGVDTRAEKVIVRSSNTETPLSSSAQGNFVGYSKVSVSDVDQQGNSLGKTEYYYHNEPDEKGNGVFNLPGFPVTIHANNGNLLKEVMYSSTGEILKKKEVQFHKDDTTAILVKGIYARTPLKEPPSSSSGFSPMFRFYRIYSEWWYPKTTIETTYDENGANPMTITTDFEYANPVHKLLTKSTTLTSEGRSAVTTLMYPSDNPTGTSMTTSTLNRMVTDNILNPVIKQETILDNSVTTNGIINNFIIDVNDHIVLDNVQILKAKNSTYETRLKYHRYDSKGNVLDISTMSGQIQNTHTAFLWGYNNSYPIAQITNAKFSEVLIALGLDEATLDLLANENVPSSDYVTRTNNLRSNLPKAQITTYTYKPMIGMNSMTDPNTIITYYNYDIFNRLLAIKDDKGNIVKAYDYHYKR